MHVNAAYLQCSFWIPAFSITADHLAMSFFMRAVISSGVLPRISRPSVRPFSWRSGTSITSLIAFESTCTTPETVVQVLSKAINDVMLAPDLQEKGRTLGLEMRGSTPEEMTARMKNDIAKWSAVIE